MSNTPRVERREANGDECRLDQDPVESILTDQPDFRTRMLQRYMPDGILLVWPSKFKRQYIVIEEIARRFEPGIDYTEREVDTLLKSIYPPDHCTLRRYLVELRFVRRQNGIYRR